MRHEKPNFNIVVGDNGYILEIERPYDETGRMMEEFKDQAIELMKEINQSDGDEWKNLVDKQVDELKNDVLPNQKPHELLVFASKEELMKYLNTTL